MGQHHNPQGAAVTVHILLQEAIDNGTGLRINWRTDDRIPNGEWPRGECPTIVLPHTAISQFGACDPS